MHNVNSVGVLIIGAGFSGLGALIKLLEQGRRDVVLIEKADEVGGTWRDNTYPACACDVPSALYSYSFAQKSDWSRLFAAQPEILAYIKDVVAQYQLQPFLRFGEEALSAVWQEDGHYWQVTTPKAVYHARAVISCAGYLHEPILPQIDGLAEFRGELFHSARWDHAADLTGKRIAVIGTGASAIQFVPELQQQASHLTVYQRSAQWILPKPDQTLSPLAHKLLELPFAKQALRGMLYGGFESFGLGFQYPSMLKQVERLARLHLRLAVKDPVKRAQLTPNYTLGCKRILLSNQYYPALCADNVSLVTDPIVKIDGNTIITASGSRTEVDVIVLGTGFYVSEPPIAERVTGVDGITMAQHWQGSPQAYKGTTLHGFPNLFILLGPNLAIGHNSAFIVIEAQLNQVMQALQLMQQQQLTRLEPRRAIQADYNHQVQRALQRTVWNTGGCSSYYIDKNGRNSIGFPWSTLKMRQVLDEFAPHDFNIQTTAAVEVNHA